MLTEEDFEKLPLPSKHTIELSAFVKEEEIDPVYYERSYYLEPDERAREGLRAPDLRAWRRRSLTAIANITIRKKEQLCALRPQDGAHDAGDALLPGRDPGRSRRWISRT